VVKMRNVVKWSSFPSLLLCVVFVALNGFITKGFLSWSSMGGFLQAIIPLIILSIGESVVLLGGGIDISVGASVSLINVILATMSQRGTSAEALIGIALICGLAIGALNGLLISIVRISPLLVTFATSYIISGMALTILPTPGGSMPDSLTNFYLSNVLFVIPSAVIFLAIVYAIWLVWHLSPMSTHLYATGNNIFKAFYSGIAVTRIQFMTYLFAGFASSIAALALTSYMGAGDARVGLPLTLNAIAACVIGGISLAGGAGNVSGAVFGSFFLGLVLTIILGLGIPTYYQNFASGLVILIGIFTAVMAGKKGVLKPNR